MRTRVAALGAATLVCCYLLFVCTGAGQRLDNRVWSWTGGVFDRPTQTDLLFVVRRVLPPVGGAVLLLHSIVRRSWRLMAVGVAVWAGTTVLAFALREVLPRPLLGDNGGKPINSFPSTHVALAATPLIAVLVIDAVRRELAVLYGLVVAAILLGNTLLMVHRFSDGLGSVALAVTTSALACGMTAHSSLHTWRR